MKHLAEKLVIAASLICVITSGFVIFQNREVAESWIRPLLMGGSEKDEDFDPEQQAAKHRRWNADEAAQARAEYEAIRAALPAPRPRGAGGSGINSYAGGAVSGQWISRGPKNMPGAWEFTEMDDGTDTVYGVTCGHYGGVQFIWKGTLSSDQWTLINPKHPSRFTDLRVIPNGSSRRIIAGHESGGIMYSDNSGATWTYATGISSGLKSMIVSRSGSEYTVYATDGAAVYRSSDKGASFSQFQSFGAATNARLYSPRFDAQPNVGDVYFARGSSFHKLNTGKTAFDFKGSIDTDGRIGIGGDSRRLWITLNDSKWYSSTNDGASFTYMPTECWWYDDLSADMPAGHYPGVSPANPAVIIGGYSVPLTSQNAGVTTNSSSKSWWGYYQNSVGNDPKVRIHYHPDFQASQFFYDKSGALLTLRASDGGILRSYNEWTKTDFPTLASIEDVYYNISLFNAPTQECYRGSFIYGAKSVDHMSSGTQDQGWQDVRANTYGQAMLSWDQVGGGDGPCSITGDGLIGWKFNYQGNAEFQRFPLYNGSTYTGQTGAKSAAQSFNFTGSSYFTPAIGDWQNGDRIWVMSQSLRRMVYSGGSISATEKNFTGGSTYIQGLAQSHKTADVVYAMQDGGVWKSSDRGTNWTPAGTKSATGMSGIGEDRGMGWGSPVSDNIVLFAAQSGTAVKSVFSKDGGGSWKNVTGSGANLFPAAEVNGMAGNAAGTLVFASTSKGPYVFVIAEEKWYPLATDADMPIFWGQMCFSSTFNGVEVVHFSTWGQGVWDFVIDNNSPRLDLTNPSGSSYAPGATVPISWNTNQSGTVNVDLMKAGTVLKNIGTADAAGTLSWTIGSDVGTGTGYSIRLTLGSLTASSTSFSIMAPLVKIPQHFISVFSFDSEENAADNAAANTLDGNAGTIWHTDYSTTSPVYPHEIVFAIDAAKINVANLMGFSYTARSGAGNGTVKDCSILVSSDGLDWTAAKTTQLAANDAEQIVLFDAAAAGNTAIYVKFLASSEQSGQAWASMAEFNLYCDSYDTLITKGRMPRTAAGAFSLAAAGSSLRISLPAADYVSLTVFDLAGRTVYAKKQNLPAGMSSIGLGSCGLAPKQYLVRLQGASGMATTKMVLK